MDPFSAPERQNFPAFSPVFNGKLETPSSSEKRGGFRWSIDELARLRPAEIKTDPTTLAETNGHSPGNDVEAQKAIDQFFSQQTILPSPWTGTKTVARPKTPLPRKRVTFSPLPPATACRGHTHTLVSVPSPFHGSVDRFGRIVIRDNDSLAQSTELKDSNCADACTQTVLTFPSNCDLTKLLGPAFCYQQQQQSDEQCKGGDIANSSLRRKLFGQPERVEGVGSSHDEREGGNTRDEASMEVQSPRLSPVSCDVSGLESTPLPGRAIGNRLSSTPLLDSPYMSKEAGLGFENPAHSSMLLSTPCKDLLGLSPIGNNCYSQGLPLACTPTPSKNPPTSRENFAPVTPLLSPIAIRTQATSTPNAAVCKRELTVSPFASPVLKHPCTSHPDDDDSPPLSSAVEGEEDSEEIAQPLSLADLKTQTEEDLTNITSATTCTSYFTQLGLEEGDPRPAAMMTWQPPIHSTMLDSQHPQPNAMPMNIPSIRFVPQPTSSANSLVTDSGVAASNDFNTTSGLTSSLSNDFCLTKSTSASLLPVDTSSNLENVAKLSSSQGAYLKTIRHPDLPTIQEKATRACADCDSGLVFSPEGTDRVVTGKVTSNPAKRFNDDYQILIPSVNSRLTPQHVLAVNAHPHLSTPHYRGSTPRATPTRFNTELVGYPAGRLSSRAMIASSVLPSRLKLSPSVSPSHRTYRPPVFEGDALYGNAGSLVTTKYYSTPPSRYSRLRLTQRLLGNKSSFANLTDEVLRKKDTLKARLQLNSPVRSPSPFSPNHMTSSPAHMMASPSFTPLQELPLNNQLNSSIPFSPTFAKSPWQPVFDNTKPVLLH